MIGNVEWSFRRDDTKEFGLESKSRIHREKKVARSSDRHFNFTDHITRLI